MYVLLKTIQSISMKCDLYITDKLKVNTIEFNTESWRKIQAGSFYYV